MDTITAILSPEADGAIHLQVPEDMRRAKFRVTATVEPEPPTTELEDRNPMTFREALEYLRTAGTFKEITDPVAWQREIRRDRPLEGRVER